MRSGARSLGGTGGPVVDPAKAVLQLPVALARLTLEWINDNFSDNWSPFLPKKSLHIWTWEGNVVIAHMHSHRFLLSYRVSGSFKRLALYINYY